MSTLTDATNAQVVSESESRRADDTDNTHTMFAIARVGLRPAAVRSVLARLPQQPARLVSTSTTRAATPASGPVSVGSAPAGPRRPTHSESEHLPLVDYSKGPSALDKAANVFFFTEILRGEPRVRDRARAGNTS